MSIVLGILAFVLMLSLIVVIHEGGHFAMAKSFGVYCHEFSLGMGPVLWQKKGKETTYSLRALPLGGYVMMAGENDQQTDEEDDWQKDVPQDRRLSSKPAWQQMAVMAAGPIMNFILAAFLIVGYTAMTGQSIVAQPVIDTVLEESAAQDAGLESGDSFLELQKADGSTLEPETQNDIAAFLEGNEDSPVKVTVQKEDGTIVEETITPRYDEESQRYLIGYQAQTTTEKLNLVDSISLGFRRIGDLIVSMFSALGNLFMGNQLDQLSGPVGIYQVTSQAVSVGWDSYLVLIALISLNVGIFNLLPIPALDGGRIVLLGLERVFKRKIPSRVLTGIISVSFVLLIGIMLFATYNDVVRLFG